MTTPQAAAAGYNPEAHVHKWTEALDLRVNGRTIAWIARDMGSRRGGGRPYSTGTIARWLDKGMERLAPAREQLAEKARSLDLIRIDKRLADLEVLFRPDEDGKLEFNEGHHRAYVGYLKRRAFMLGYDAPSHLLVHDMAGEISSAFAMIVREVIVERLPEEVANELLTIMEQRINERNGESVPIEAKVIETTAEVVEGE